MEGIEAGSTPQSYVKQVGKQGPAPGKRVPAWLKRRNFLWLVGELAPPKKFARIPQIPSLWKGSSHKVPKYALHPGYLPRPRGKPVINVTYICRARSTSHILVYILSIISFNPRNQPEKKSIAPGLQMRKWRPREIKWITYAQPRTETQPSCL